VVVLVVVCAGVLALTRHQWVRALGWNVDATTWDGPAPSASGPLPAEPAGLVWSHRSPGPGPHAITVDHGIAFVTEKHGVHAVRLSDGRELWHYVDHDVDAGDMPPVVGSGVVGVRLGLGFGSLWLLDETTGRFLRHFTAPSGTVHVALSSGTLVTFDSGDDDGNVRAFRISDGRRLWTWHRSCGSGRVDDLEPLVASTTVAAYTICKQGEDTYTHRAVTGLDVRTGAVRDNLPVAYEPLEPDQRDAARGVADTGPILLGGPRVVAVSPAGGRRLDSAGIAGEAVSSVLTTDDGWCVEYTKSYLCRGTSAHVSRRITPSARDDGVTVSSLAAPGRLAVMGLRPLRGGRYTFDLTTMDLRRGTLRHPANLPAISPGGLPVPTADTSAGFVLHVATKTDADAAIAVYR
jgi:hypothetical protein